jgi:phytoene synthase
MSRDTSFYYSFLVLPAEKRKAIIAVWDFCRAVDDEADCVETRKDLDGWRRELAACYGAGAPQTPQGRALAPCVARYGLPRRAFDDLIDGVAMDLQPRRYDTFEDLYEYCYRVASAVGLVCVEIFGYRNPASRQYAVDLGIALQLTNIVRDLGADVAAGRLYLPLEDLRAFGCDEDDLRAGRRSRAVVGLLRHECERAHQYYARARAGLPREDARSLVAAAIMGEIYFAILRRIESSGYDVFSSVIRVPRPRRAIIAGATWARTMLGR